MALTKESVVEKIEVLEWGHIQVRRSDRVLEDGKIIAHSLHRVGFSPVGFDDELTDMTGQDARVIAIANATWTDECIAAFRAQVIKDKLAPNSDGDPTD